MKFHVENPTDAVMRWGQLLIARYALRYECSLMLMQNTTEVASCWDNDGSCEGLRAHTQEYIKTLPYTYNLGVLASTGNLQKHILDAFLVDSAHRFIKMMAALAEFTLREFYDPNMHAQMVFKDFLATNLLLSCFSLNWFEMVFVQLCWHNVWCMRLIYMYYNGNLCLMSLMLGIPFL